MKVLATIGKALVALPNGSSNENTKKHMGVRLAVISARLECAPGVVTRIETEQSVNEENDKLVQVVDDIVGD